MQQVALSSMQTLETRLVSNNELKLDPQHITDIHNHVARGIRQSLGISDAETEYYDLLELRFRLAAIRAERAELMR
jgi:CPA1 family monovalent cation:H+ antiporter